MTPRASVLSAPTSIRRCLAQNKGTITAEHSYRSCVEMSEHLFRAVEELLSVEGTTLRTRIPNGGPRYCVVSTNLRMEFPVLRSLAFGEVCRQSGYKHDGENLLIFGFLGDALRH